MATVTFLFAPLGTIASTLGQDLDELRLWVRVARLDDAFPVPYVKNGRTEYFRVRDFRAWRDRLAARHGVIPTAMAS